MPRENLSIHLAERPEADIIPGKTFEHKVRPIPSPSDLKDGEILVETLYLSLEPAMRGWLNDARSYYRPIRIGERMHGSTAARVLASRNKLAKPGDIVKADCGWIEYAIVKPGNFEPASRFPGMQQPQDVISMLGTTGCTAWWGMTQIGDPKPGELVVVSGAAGATGSIAGQIAKIKGARVVGICGADDKCKWLVDELGFDVALNYKAKDFKQQFKEATKSYIDVYFDNVGGDTLDAALARAKENARFVECGMISQYNVSKPSGLTKATQIITMRIKMQGFVVLDHVKEFPRMRKEMSQWMAEGKLKKTETVVKCGLKGADATLRDLFKGVNTGKLLVEIKDPDEVSPKL